MSHVRVLILGKNGQLGYELDQVFSESSNFEVLAVARESVDLTNKSSIVGCLKTFHPDIVINATAYTAVDKAEQEQDKAYAVNANANLLLIESIHEVYGHDKNKAPWIIHFSTDYVFDGKANEPYRESSKTSPLGIYGQSKYQGEQNLLLNYDNVLIFRISWVYSYRAANFVKTMLRLGAEKAEIGVVSDQYGCPNYAPDIAASMTQVIDKVLEGSTPKGIYHLTSTEVTTWCDFAREIMKKAHLSCQVNAIKTSEFPTLAERPLYSVMSANEVKRVFNIELPSWKNALTRCLQKISHE